MNESEKGAYTGEVSPSMIKSIGVSRVIIGHSERRAYYNENDQVLKKKINNALKNQIEIIFCFGEQKHLRRGIYLPAFVCRRPACDKFFF